MAPVKPTHAVSCQPDAILDLLIIFHPEDLEESLIQALNGALPESRVNLVSLIGIGFGSKDL